MGRRNFALVISRTASGQLQNRFRGKARHFQLEHAGQQRAASENVRRTSDRPGRKQNSRIDRARRRPDVAAR